MSGYVSKNVTNSKLAVTHVFLFTTTCTVPRGCEKFPRKPLISVDSQHEGQQLVEDKRREVGALRYSTLMDHRSSSEGSMSYD